MFEIVVTACLLAQPEVCRDLLADDRFFKTRAACQETIRKTLQKSFATTRGHDLLLAPDVTTSGQPHCAATTGAGLTLTAIAPGVYVHQGQVAEPDAENLGDVANLGVVIGKDSIAVIDAGGSRAVGEALVRSIRALSDLPISHVILTHMHPDHVLGASVFVEAGAVVVGHPSLGRALMDRAQSYMDGYGRLIGAEAFVGTRVVGPMAAQTPMTIDLGERPLRLVVWPTAHSPTDIGVIDEVTGTLFVGDIIFDRHVPVLDGSLRGWLSVLDEIEGMDTKRLVPGHGRIVFETARDASGEASGPVRAYLQALERETRVALDDGLRLGEASRSVGQSQANNWELFEAFNARNATAAYTELEWD